MLRALLVLGAAALVAAIPQIDPPIDAMVTKSLKANMPVDILVHLKEKCATQAAAAKATRMTVNATKPSKSELRVFVHDVLVDFTKDSQAGVLAAAKAEGLEAKGFWASNTVYIKLAAPELVRKLSARSDVDFITGNVEYSIIDNVVGKTMEDKFKVEASNSSRRRTQIFEYGIVLTRGEDAQLAGYTGEGVVVMNVDTGVRWTHESLIGNYRGMETGTAVHDYNWIGPGSSGNPPAPVDNNGHGTHTMGTIAGGVARGIGMSPGAKWIAGAGCNPQGSCPTVDLIESLQFGGCPTRTDGTDPDCTRAADIVSNSWGGGRGSATFHDVISVLDEEEIIVVFSMGNSGPSCGSANSPGDFARVISVGASDNADNIASFSSRGPGVGGDIFPIQQPFIDGPGVAVVSAFPGSDTQYASSSGTSMSCPHVAGYIAQLLGAYPDLTIEDVRRAMTTASFRDMQEATPCNDIPTTTYPNLVYGYGRIDTCAALGVLGSSTC